VTGHDWEASAACAEVDPALWFPTRGGDGGAEATRICTTSCPVRDECLTDAMAEEAGLGPKSRHGVRGGLGPRQRAARDKETAAAERPPALTTNP
jgi:WhiB family redox-sensing transcriptional regulator